MREVEVVGVRVEMPSNQPIVLLRESTGERYLPIWIGAVEATAIAFAQQGVVPPRPLTHDLLKNVIDATGNDLTEIRITEVRDGVYYATLAFDSGVEVSARPSDSIALALRTGARIVCSDELLDATGIEVARRAGGRGREVPRVPRPRQPGGLRGDRDDLTLKLRFRVTATRGSAVFDRPSSTGLPLRLSSL